MTPSSALPLFKSACADTRIVIVPGAFNPGPGCYCPVGALGTTVPKLDPLDGLCICAARVLGIDSNAALAVALGFDGEPASDAFHGEWWMLGRELRREWEAGRLGRQT